ncbi:MAG TPA: 2-dehydropantoate 2-reductase, partial [Thermodesulfobacteriota bacterium]|nr:2-dehydropantoate 2-reductase [Thermodesulfobacteriota bacterium]
RMRVAIVGAGAMGCLFGFFLHKAGKEVWLLEKYPDLVKQIRENGIRVEGISGDHHVFPPITAEAGEIKEADLILIFVKAFDTFQAIQSVKPLVGPDSMVLTLQNGIGNIEEIVKVVGTKPNIAGTTAHGATVLGLGHIRHAGTGETVIGELDGKKTSRLEKVKVFLESAGINVQITQDVTGLLWSKLLINVGINPLTGITGLRNGELLDYEETRAIMHRAVNEAKSVADRKGIRLVYYNHLQKVEAVCQATAQNVSSMLQDIRNKKKTEIDFINGAILREGKEFDMELPINQALTHLIHLMEHV